jgi:hypothetical protein
MLAALVLYEDNRGQRPREGFGPHALALACVADDTGVDRWDLRAALVDNVRNNREAVLRSVREQAEALSGSAARIVVLLDHDGVRRGKGVELPAGACKTAVLEAVQALWAGSRHLIVVLLEENVEDLVWHAARALGKPLERPISHSPNVRDPPLQAAAAHPDRAVRDRIRQGLPSFDRLVRRLVEAWESNPAA